MMQWTMGWRSAICGIVVFCTTAVGGHASAELLTASLAYEHEGVTLSAYIARPDNLTEPTPGILIAHAWWGQGEYARHRARQLAEMGYIAVALDMYGQDVYTDDPDEAGKMAKAFYQDRQLFRDRAAAGLKMLMQQPEVDPERLAAIGYCFGGTTVMELAYSGADLAAVVSFHGSLLPPRPDSDDAEQVKAKVLICHGQADPFYPMEKLLGVIDPLQAADVELTTVIYGGAVHSFTDPSATGEMEGAKYDRAADHRSWQHMKLVFDEVFAAEE